jgi:translation initiation factor 5A
MRQQAEVRQLKEGGYVIIDDEPCEILSISISKPGKHGSAKARIDAIGIFDGQKRSIVQPVSARAYIPIVERGRAQIISVVGNIAQLMDLETYETFELTVPAGLEGKVEPGKEVVYIKSLGKRKLAEK